MVSMTEVQIDLAHILHEKCASVSDPADRLHFYWQVAKDAIAAFNDELAEQTKAGTTEKIEAADLREALLLNG